MKILMSSLAVAMSLCASTAFAGSDIFLQIKGSKSDSAAQIVKCPNGACSVSSLSADTYSVSFVDASGKPVSVDKKYDCVVSPRDVSSGQASGKRMHKPITFTKELSVAQLVTTDASSSLDISCSSPTVSAPVVAAPAEAKTTATYDLKAAKK